MFKIGETIVCIDSDKIIMIDCDKIISDYGLTQFKCYDVLEFKGKPFDPEVSVHIMNDRYETQNYSVRRFITLVEYRKLKIKKLTENIRPSSLY